MEWPLLAPLTDAERQHVLATARPRRFAGGEVVFHAGDPADSLHLVSKGRLAVRASTPDGDVMTLNLLSPGSYFGELALLRQDVPHQRTATVIALEAAETLSLSAGSFHRLCDTHPRVEHLLTTLLALRVEELSERLLEALYVGLDRRVYRRLIELSEMYAAGAAATVIPLTQDQLADLVGGTRPSVNQVLQRLAGQNVVSLRRGRIEVLDRATLERRAGL
ncbi:MAG: Crp/Fnr family transcriptional regulator [Propionibacteriales bacterium]|nr:Crp/Fnr family transcriptional regulator [Propionibacteriales bacterium]